MLPREPCYRESSLSHHHFSDVTLSSKGKAELDFSTTFQCFGHCFTMLSSRSHKELLILCPDLFFALNVDS